MRPGAAVRRRDEAFVKLLAKTELVHKRTEFIAGLGHTSRWQIDLRRHPYVIAHAPGEELPGEQLPNGIESITALYLTREGIEREANFTFRL